MPNGSNHPFATTMLNHFNKLQSALRVVEKYPSICDQMQRFRAEGWQSVSAKSLWTLWNDATYFDASERKKLNAIEIFDEWEEFALFSSHYFLLIAKTVSGPFKIYETLGKVADIDLTEQQGLSRVQRRCGSIECPPRRFGVLYQVDDRTFDFNGGEDATRRVASTGTFSLSPYSGRSPLSNRPSTTVRVFHSVTPLTERFDCLISGGRDGPDKPLSDTWLRRGEKWRKVADLPIPLYRHATTLVRDGTDDEGVLVFGGRTRQGALSSAWYLWQEKTEWREVRCMNEVLLPRFSANIISSEAKNTGLLLGGMSEEGKVLDECYGWTFWSRCGQPQIKLESCLLEPTDAAPLCRIGASLISSPQGLYLVGGVQSSGLPPLGHEVYRLNYTPVSQHQISWSPIPTPWDRNQLDQQPLLIGHSAIWDGEGVVVIGGGATCFSFGKHMNASIWKFNDREQDDIELWKYVQLHQPSTVADGGSKRREPSIETSNPLPNRARVEPPQIRKVTLSDALIFWETVSEGTPAIFPSLDLGPCVNKWTPKYLKESVGPTRLLDVHHAQESTMSFEKKNFIIRKNTFAEFLDAIVRGEARYLRSVSSLDRHKPANFSQDFEALNTDFILADELTIPTNKTHSSVLRISGPINMWLHYDVMLTSTVTFGFVLTWLIR